MSCDVCYGCRMPLDDSAHPSMIDLDNNQWHRDCLRQYRVGIVIKPKHIGQCPHCGNDVTNEHKYRLTADGWFYHQHCWDMRPKSPGKCERCSHEIKPLDDPYIKGKHEVYHIACYMAGMRSATTAKFPYNFKNCVYCHKPITKFEIEHKNNDGLSHYKCWMAHTQ